MDKLVAIRIKHNDGTYSNEIPLSVLAVNIDWDGTHNLVDVLGNVDLNKGSIQEQINALITTITPDNVQYDLTHTLSDVLGDVDLDKGDLQTQIDNISDGEIQVDSTLTAAGKAADAKAVGDNLKNVVRVGNSNVTNFTSIILGGTEEQVNLLDQSDLIGINTRLSALENGGGGGSNVQVDQTLSVQGMAADAKATGDAINLKINKPVTNPNGTQGQLLQTDGQGGTNWVSVETTPTDAQTNNAISTWLNEHPEAITTVQDGSITETKLDTNLKKLQSDMFFNFSDAPSIIIPSWEEGGLYDATGIEYGGSDQAKTKFIPVKPGSTIKIMFNSSAISYIAVRQFANNTHTTSSNNTRVAIGTISNSGGTLTLSDNTNYIRLQTNQGCSVQQAEKNVALYYDIPKTITTFVANSSNVIQGTYAAPLSSLKEASNRLRISDVIHVEAGSQIHFIPGTNIKSFIYAYRRRNYGDFVNNTWRTSEVTISIPYETEIVCIFATENQTDDISPAQFDATLTITTKVSPNKLLIYDSLKTALKDVTLQRGRIIKTLGFDHCGDFGGGYYIVVNNITPDNCVSFAVETDGVYLSRLFTDSYFYLESLNYQNIAMSTIRNILNRSGIRDLRCYKITTDVPIGIRDFNFTFNIITYNGSGYAIEIDSTVNKTIKGNAIYAPNGNGICLTTENATVASNYIQINQIEVKDIGIGIFPTKSRGISENTYKIKRIYSKLYGIRSYIPHSQYYSWEGEEIFHIGHIRATNGTNGNGTAEAVSLQIDPDPTDGVTKSGTITGLTFLHLSVENSDNGICMRCGSFNSNRIDACIKSIYINNLRGRETWTKGMWGIGRGYLRDILIKPTAPTRFFQWDIQSTAGYGSCIIDGPICYYDQTSLVANGLITRLNKIYVKPLKKMYNVVQNIDMSFFDTYTPFQNADNAHLRLFFADTFHFDESLRGQTTELYLAHYMDDGAKSLKFILPGATQADGAITAKIKYYFPKKSITLTNSSNDTHIYEISIMQGCSWGDDVRFIVKDLGTIDQDTTVAWNYDEDA